VEEKPPGAGDPSSLLPDQGQYVVDGLHACQRPRRGAPTHQTNGNRSSKARTITN
jgi:hypothetical protein